MTWRETRSAIFWSVLIVSLALNVANLLFDGLPLAMLMIGVCMR